MSWLTPTDEYYKSMQLDFSSRNKKRTETINSEKLYYNTRDNHYSLLSFSAAHNVSIGTLLTSFLNTDFTSYDGFLKFVNTWGLPGLITITDRADIDYTTYTVEEYTTIMNAVYSTCEHELRLAQEKFKFVVDYIINYMNAEHLEGLTPLQRYYILIQIDSLSDLEEYNNTLKVHYRLDRFAKNPNFTLKEYANELSLNEVELAQRLKTNDIAVEETYFSQDIRSFLFLEFKELITSEFTIQKCRNCGTYFIYKALTDKYCVNCRKVGYENSLKSDPILNLYRSKNKVKDKAKKRYEVNNNTPLVNKITEWKKEAKKRISKYKDGEMNQEEIDEFERWLKNSTEV